MDKPAPNSDSEIPYGNVTSVGELGHLIRARRKALGLEQRAAAGLCGVGVRFLSELERGKATAELGRTLQVLSRLGLKVAIEAPRS